MSFEPSQPLYTRGYIRAEVRGGELAVGGWGGGNKAHNGELKGENAAVKCQLDSQVKTSRHLLNIKTCLSDGLY